LTFLLFSLVSAFFLLAGFAGIAALNGTTDLSALVASGPDAAIAFVLLAVGCLIKAGAIGVHVWLPGAYTEADDDFTAMLSGVVSKVAMFGLLTGTYLAILSKVSLEIAHGVAWVGMLTTIAGALLALHQTDFKRLLAFSSMSQLGYIVTAIALMSHLGWVTALYLVANHMMVKGILFLAVAGIILRSGTREFDGTGGLARAMPVTFILFVVAIISMSGLPPLMGFDGKWLLLSAMTDKGWNGLAIAGIVATFLGFLYMIRLVAGLFFGRRAAEQKDVSESPIALLAPQALLVAGILLSETADGPRLCGDRPAIRLDAGLGRHVALHDLRLLEPDAGDAHLRRGRGRTGRCRLARLSQRHRPFRQSRALLCLLPLADRAHPAPAGDAVLGRRPGHHAGGGGDLPAGLYRQRPDLCALRAALFPRALWYEHGSGRVPGRGLIMTGDTIRCIRYGSSMTI